MLRCPAAPGGPCAARLLLGVQPQVWFQPHGWWASCLRSQTEWGVVPSTGLRRDSCSAAALCPLHTEAPDDGRPRVPRQGALGRWGRVRAAPQPCCCFQTWMSVQRNRRPARTRSTARTSTAPSCARVSAAHCPGLPRPGLSRPGLSRPRPSPRPPWPPVRPAPQASVVCLCDPCTRHPLKKLKGATEALAVSRPPGNSGARRQQCPLAAGPWGQCSADVMRCLVPCSILPQQHCARVCPLRFSASCH